MSEKSKSVGNPYALEIVVPFSLEQSIEMLKLCQSKTVTHTYERRVTVDTQVKSETMATFVVTGYFATLNALKTIIYQGSLRYDEERDVTTLTCKRTSTNPYVAVLPWFITIILFVCFFAFALVNSGALPALGGVLLVVAATGSGYPFAVMNEFRHQKALLGQIEKVFTPHGL